MDHIEHVVVLMLENHSFDQMLGSLSTVIDGLDGIDPNKPGSNPDFPDFTKLIYQSETKLTSIPLDPAHEFVDVNHQLAHGMTGFISDYVQANPNCTSDEKNQIMGYYPVDFLPVLHCLAKNFVVCDRWFSSLPGPTWPNRFFVHSGTSMGHVKMPSGVFDPNWHCYDQATVYERLSQKGVSWNIYHEGEAQSLVLVHQLLYVDHYHTMDEFFSDTQQDHSAFPQYVFIEPCYSGAGQNDQHPPSDIMKGELLIAKVYNALKSNQDLWNRTLLVVLYDEHGGFYDHVQPQGTVAPDGNTDEFSFDMLGLRVPALLVSPWLDPGVLHTTFDHTSLLKYVTDKWGLGDLGKRTAQASSFASELEKRAEVRPQTPGLFTGALLGPQELANTDVNQNQASLISFSQLLEAHMSGVEDLAAVGSRTVKMVNGPQAQISVAKDRYDRFIDYMKKGTIDPKTDLGIKGATEAKP